jgi:hypothetical protein
MRDQRRDTNRRLKRQVECKKYRVDPDRVASALIVRLVLQEGALAPPPTDGPNHANGVAGRIRQAA